MFVGLEHTAIASPDPAKLARWYVDHLDFRINFEYDGNYFVRAANGAMLEIIPSEGVRGEQKMRDPGIRHLAIEVTDFDSAHAALKAKGVAFAGGVVVRVPSQGEIQRALVPAGAVKPGALDAADLPADRRRAARIGTTWLLSRGDPLRVWPDVAPANGPAGHPDTTVLVGGADHGLSIDVAGSALNVASIDPTGRPSPLAHLAPSPVRPGLDACERAGGTYVDGKCIKIPIQKCGDVPC